MLNLSQYIRVVPQKDIDMKYVLRLRHELNQKLDLTNKHVLLDFSHVSHIDSSGIALILSLARYISRIGGSLIMVNIEPDVFHIFEITNISRYVVCTPKGTAKNTAPSTHDEKPKQVLNGEFSKDSLAEARARIADFLKTSGLTQYQQSDYMLGIGEALGNVVLHTDKGIGSFDLEVFPNYVRAVIEDEGEGFALDSDSDLPKETLEHGRGIKLMRMVFDTVSIQPRVHSSGTRVEVTKRMVGTSQ